MPSPVAQVLRPHELVQGKRGATFGTRANPVSLKPARPEGAFDVRAGDAPPPLGGRPGCYAGSPSRGYPGYARDRARVGERADRRQDPELPRGLLPDHPRLSPVAAS